MSNNIPGTGEIWVLKDNQGIKRDALILSSTPDGYTSGWLLHTYSKHAENLVLKTVRGERYIDPRKLTYWHTNQFHTQICELKTNDYLRVKTKAAQLLGMGVQDKELEARCATAETNVASMAKKIAELTLERDLYKGLCEKAISGQAQNLTAPVQTAAQTDAEEERKKRRAEVLAYNKAHLLPKQAYIAEKLKSVHMSQITCGMLLGVAGNTVSGWIHGSSPAQWDKMEKVFPGIEQEADAWAQKKKEEQR